jgi:membrane fusion protein, heavy metal efflux system
MNRQSITLLLLVAAACLLYAGCGAAPPPEAEAAVERPNPLEIEVDDNLMQRIQVGEVALTQVTETLRVAGRVEADETRMARINAPVTGRIGELRVIEGQYVEEGEVLATIHSTELTNAQSALLRALTEHRMADRAVARAKQLLDAGVIGTAELQRREAELQQAATELVSLREQLRILGMPAEAMQKIEKTHIVDSLTHVLSTIKGRVLERRVTPGQVVQAAEIVCVIADLSNVWLVADIPEQSAGHIRIGQAVEAELPALPGRKITGEISFVSATVNPETRTVRARMNVRNPAREYKPAMLATMILRGGSERRTVIPSSAIVREGNEESVFVQTGPRSFVLRKVSLGEEHGDGQILLGGIEENTTIVTEGAFHLNNERRRRAVRNEGG